MVLLVRSLHIYSFNRGKATLTKGSLLYYADVWKFDKSWVAESFHFTFLQVLNKLLRGTCALSFQSDTQILIRKY